MLNFNHRDGEKPVHIALYTLSTCGWCKKTKALLEELGIGYDYIDVDLLSGDEKQQAKEEILKWNEHCSFPTVVIDNTECIVGFKEDKLREAVGK
jgi:glutaredoxin